MFSGSDGMRGFLLWDVYNTRRAVDYGISILLVSQGVEVI